MLYAYAVGAKRSIFCACFPNRAPGSCSGGNGRDARDGTRRGLELELIPFDHADAVHLSCLLWQLLGLSWDGRL